MGILRRQTFDMIRVTISGGNVYLGCDQYTRKPLTADQIDIFAEIVGMVDASEIVHAIKAARMSESPREAMVRFRMLAADFAAKNS